MSLNQTLHMDKKKISKFGKLFGTIDFFVKNELSEAELQNKGLKSIVGEFQIGDKKYPVTLEELNQIQSTAESAYNVVIRKFKMGRLL